MKTAKNKSDAFLMRSTKYLSVAFLIALAVNLFTMPSSIPRCDKWQNCELFRVGTYYWNLYSFYALIGLGALVLIFGVMYLRTGQKLDFVSPVRITQPDTKGKLAILFLIVAVGFGFAVLPEETECKPGYALTSGIDSYWCTNGVVPLSQ
jgi:preprotein translocase subunit SecG